MFHPSNESNLGKYKFSSFVHWSIYFCERKSIEKFNVLRDDIKRDNISF